MDHIKPQRKVFYLLLVCVFAVAGGNLAYAADDNLNMVFTTTSAGGEYGNKHVHVVWIKDSSDNFVYTSGSTTTDNKRAVWASTRASSLTEWWDSNVANRSADVVAMTGATQTAYKTYNLNWNWKRKDGTTLPDGTYQIHFLCTNAHSGTPNNKAFFSITKGPNPQTVGPTTQNGYNNVTLTFTPGIAPAPTVTNSPVTNITADSATLNGNVNLDSDVTIYWGDEDGGTTPGNWDHQVDLPGTLAGNFSTGISSLLPETTYYFRCYADNESPTDGGTDWADSTSSFTSASAVPDIDLSSESLDFGEIEVGFYADLTFDIQNAGFGGDLIVESLEITGLSKSAFSIVSPSVPFNVASISGIQTVTVRFTPGVYAENYASVSIGNNDPGLTVADVSLTGTGTMDAEVSLSALSGVGGIANAVVPVGSNLFVAQGAMLTILDASTPSALELVGQVRLDDIIEDITVAGNTAYAAIGASGMQAVDVTTLSAPIALAAFDTPGYAYEIDSEGSTLCIADGIAGTHVYDISTPLEPVITETIETTGAASSVEISNELIYILNESEGMYVLSYYLDEGAYAYWKLDETTGTTAPDASINSHDGTLMNMDDTDWVTGKTGNALNFDGVNNYVAVDGICAGLAGGDVTVSAWMKASTTNTDYQFMISINTSNGDDQKILLGTQANSDTLSMYESSEWHDTATTVIDNTWHHIAYVLEDSSNTITIYVNGSGVSSFASTASIAASDVFSLGQEYDASMAASNFYNGLIDEVRIYDSVLNENEIQALFENQQGFALLGTCDELELGQTIAVSAATGYITDQLGNFFVVDISDPASPTLLGQTRVSAGNGTSIAISGDYAYVTNASGVEVFDIFDPSYPNSVSAYSSTPATDIAIDGTVAYMAEKGSGVRVLDLASPESPVALGDFSFQTMPKAVAAGTSTAIIADDTDGMQVVGLTDPANPDAVSSTSTGALGYAQDVAVSGSLAYLANGLLGLQIVDLTDPAVPVLLGDYPTLGFASSVAANGTTAMVADGRIVYVLDVSNSSSPTLDGEWISAGWAGGVAVDGAYGYVANGGMGIEVLNINDATSAGSLELPGVAYDIAVSGGIAYVAAGSEGLQIIDVSTPASPSVITSFDTPGMALGVTIVGSRVCVADNYSVAVIDVSTPAAPSLYAVSDIPVNSLGTDVVNSRLLVADGNAGIAILRAHAHPNFLLGDFDGDGFVDLPDLAMLAGEWLGVETMLNMLDVLFTDTTDDGTVNLQDFAIMAENWLVTIHNPVPIVQWGQRDGQTDIVPARIDGATNDNFDVYDPAVVASPSVANYYPAPSSDNRTPKFYAAGTRYHWAMEIHDHADDYLDQIDGDYIAAYDQIPSGTTAQGMVVWQSADFMPADGGVAGFNAQLANRNSTDRGDLYWLVEKNGSWYISERAGEFDGLSMTTITTDDASALTWYDFTPFGLDGNAPGVATIGSSPVTITMDGMTSVGYFFETQNTNASTKWSGSALSYFSVTATGYNL